MTDERENRTAAMYFGPEDRPTLTMDYRLSEDEIPQPMWPWISRYLTMRLEQASQDMTRFREWWNEHPGPLLEKDHDQIRGVHCLVQSLTYEVQMLTQAMGIAQAQVEADGHERKH